MEKNAFGYYYITLCIIILLCVPRMGRPVCCCVSENRGTYLYINAMNIPTGGVVSRGINP
jgi:hypothetical protein